MWLHFTQHNLFSKTCLQIVFRYYLLAYSNWWVGLRCNYRLFQLCQWTMAPHCDAPSWAWMSYFLLKWRVPVRRATRAASDKGSSSWAYLWSCLWLASELKAALLDSLIFYEGSREPKQSTTYALSCCFLYTRCFLCFTVLSFNEHTLKVTWTLSWNHFCTRARTQTLQSGLRVPAPFPGQFHRTTIAYS